MTGSNENILHYVDGPLFVIKLNKPQSLNSLTGLDYLRLAELVDKADNEPNTYFTVLQSTGRFFSSGADFGDISSKAQSQTNETELEKWLTNFLSRNVYVTSVFNRHKKILICCLNGPAVGLSAALCALCDLVYAMNDKVFLKYPFMELGLVMEGGTSVTLPSKLSSNQVTDTVLFNKNMTYEQLQGRIVTRNYNLNDANEFNERIIKDLKSRSKDIYLPSILGVKKLIAANYVDSVHRANSLEATDALSFWLRGEPQRRFQILKAKLRKHKM
ncbi:related to 3,2-trans-enoyl-CoA isomerase [Zygosaccharomyces bailii]|uniref:ZYBA0S05-01948g1_1 n=1 Tax=Zygosaccharomyces bailii (strain CLIB 213 / ATCC 58445 / CBS 680 / BCRC 21525 / NBRC 1098 / NCYC 1416 / NRRL Y-2227) TaxID=1333698 RepID=A0A8J2T6F8_ZYGB2|nr:ZYBA0S05-01948g1_1 [Zygosaccharomyces bailii CLIB 213]SJM87063.1 related to 3,2-trans-enoyl-CoA isomerase [Zygosaccharomyces bailii]